MGFCCCIQGQAASGILHPLALLNQQLFGKETRIFFFYPKLGIYSSFPMVWVVRVHFLRLLSENSTSHLLLQQSLVEHLFQSSPQECFISHGVVGWLTQEGAVLYLGASHSPEWGNLISSILKYCLI